jgi:alanyl-tRNA synthetase
MTPAEISQVEGLVNSWVAAASPTAVCEMELDTARAAGATAMFGEKYDDVVRVVEVPGVSMELCGGESGGLNYGDGCEKLPMW